MDRNTCSISIGAIVLFLGCKKDVDPAYRKSVEDWSTAYCACAKDNTGNHTARDKCWKELETRTGIGMFGVPKAGPGGEAPGVYEEKLTKADQQYLTGLRETALECRVEKR